MSFGADVEGSETEMRDELSRSISDQQSGRPTPVADWPGFTNRATKAKSYTIPDRPIRRENRQRWDKNSPIQIAFIYEGEALETIRLPTAAGPGKIIVKLSTFEIIFCLKTRPRERDAWHAKTMITRTGR